MIEYKKLTHEININSQDKNYLDLRTAACCNSRKSGFPLFLLLLLHDPHLPVAFMNPTPNPSFLFCHCWCSLLDAWWRKHITTWPCSFPSYFSDNLYFCQHRQHGQRKNWTKKIRGLMEEGLWSDLNSSSSVTEVGREQWQSGKRVRSAMKEDRDSCWWFVG